MGSGTITDRCFNSPSTRGVDGPSSGAAHSPSAGRHGAACKDSAVPGDDENLHSRHARHRDRFAAVRVEDEEAGGYGRRGELS